MTQGVKRRALLHFASEPGLKDAFAGLTGEKEGGVKVEEMARRVAASLNKVSYFRAVQMQSDNFSNPF